MRNRYTTLGGIRDYLMIGLGAIAAKVDSGSKLLDLLIGIVLGLLVFALTALLIKPASEDD